MENHQGNQTALEFFFISEICSLAFRWRVVVLLRGEGEEKTTLKACELYVIPGPGAGG